MHDERQRIHRLLVDKNVHFDQCGGFVRLQLIVEGRIASGPAFQRVEEIVNNLVQRQLVLEHCPRLLDIVGGQIAASALLAQLHDRADVIGRDHNLGVHDRLLHALDLRGIGQIGGIGQFHHRSVCLVDFVNDAGRCGDQVQIVFALKAFQHDFHMQKSEEAAAEAKAQCQ